MRLSDASKELRIKSGTADAKFISKTAKTARTALSYGIGPERSWREPTTKSQGRTEQHTNPVFQSKSRDELSNKVIRGTIDGNKSGSVASRVTLIRLLYKKVV